MSRRDNMLVISNYCHPFLCDSFSQWGHRKKLDSKLRDTKKVRARRSDAPTRILIEGLSSSAQIDTCRGTSAGYRKQYGQLA